MKGKCDGKHYWETEMGYCIACGQNMEEWFEEQKRNPELMWQPTCNCGAKFTVNPQHHSRWCSAFKETVE